MNGESLQVLAKISTRRTLRLDKVVNSGDAREAVIWWQRMS